MENGSPHKVDYAFAGTLVGHDGQVTGELFASLLLILPILYISCSTFVTFIRMHFNKRSCSLSWICLIPL
jgi:hypothetical protein